MPRGCSPEVLVTEILECLLTHREFYYMQINPELPPHTPNPTHPPILPPSRSCHTSSRLYYCAGKKQRRIGESSDLGYCKVVKSWLISTMICVCWCFLWRMRTGSGGVSGGSGGGGGGGGSSGGGSGGK